MTPELPAFDPGHLGTAEPAPDWTDYEPPGPGGLSRLFGGVARHERQTAEARARFDTAMAEHRQREAQRKRALSAARAAHESRLADVRAQAATQNAEIETRRAAFAAGDPEAVEWFVSRVLDNLSGIPPTSPASTRSLTGRRIGTSWWSSSYLLSGSFRWCADTATSGHAMRLTRFPRLATEVRQRYARLIACVALRTLHEVFVSTPGDVVEAVVFNGRVSTIDRATGKPDRPHLLSVEAERSVFEDIVLAAVEPAACLKRLNALVSPNPFDLEAVEPFIAFDLKRFRFTDDMDVIATGLPEEPAQPVPNRVPAPRAAVVRGDGRGGMDDHPLEGRGRGRRGHQ